VWGASLSVQYLSLLWHPTLHFTVAVTVFICRNVRLIDVLFTVVIR